MITRVRVEAEGSTTQEVEQILETAYEVLVNESSNSQRATMFGYAGQDGDNYHHPGLADAQAGEFVIERFARDCSEWSNEAQCNVLHPGHGAIYYKGRMTSHFARPSKPLKLDRRQDDGDPYHEA